MDLKVPINPREAVCRGNRLYLYGTTNRRYVSVGAGPLLPLSLLCDASRSLGGPDSVTGVRDRLVRLRGLAVRSAAGTEQEHAGLFHDTLVQHIAAHAPDQNRAAHRAIIA